MKITDLIHALPLIILYSETWGPQTLFVALILWGSYSIVHYSERIKDHKQKKSKNSEAS